MKSFGYKKDPQSDKDYKFESIKPGLNKLATSNSSNECIIDQNVPIFNQGSLNSCVANATVAALEILMSNGGTITALSRLFVYWNARLMDAETGQDQGTYIRNAFASLKTLGVCTEKSFPYIPSMVFAQPPINAFKEGDDNTIDSFYRISTFESDRFNDIDLAIRAGHPVVFGSSVYDAFADNDDSNGKVWGPSRDSIGTHAMCVVGIRLNGSYQKEFLIRNSWSDSWKLDGRAWVNEDFMAQAEDLWVPTLMPNLTI